jgi:uncharacterized protein YndB with AHSA1/START domain
MNQVVHVQRTSTASPDRLFELVADTEGYPAWSSFDSGRLEREGSPDRNGLGAIRNFRRGRVTGREEVVAYEPPHHYAYTVLSGVAVRDYRGDVTIAPTGDGGSAITWHSEFRAKRPGSAWISKRVLSKFVRELVEQLVREAERSTV